MGLGLFRHRYTPTCKLENENGESYIKSDNGLLEGNPGQKIDSSRLQTCHMTGSDPELAFPLLFASA
jgi:hypothetical protein